MERHIRRLLKYGTLISTYGLIASVLLQIYARFFLENTPAWTEETSRLFFIYAISFASGLALKNHYYVHLDVVFDQFSAKVQRNLLLVIQVSTLILFAFIAYFALQFVIQGHQESSPSMGTPMSFAFFSIFLMTASISYYAALEIKKSLKNWSL